LILPVKFSKQTYDKFRHSFVLTDYVVALWYYNLSN